jgi:hypothetical protein
MAGVFYMEAGIESTPTASGQKRTHDGLGSLEPGKTRRRGLGPGVNGLGPGVKEEEQVNGLGPLARVKHEANMESDPDDDAYSDGSLGAKASTNASTCGSCSETLPIIFVPGKKVVTCFLCQHSANEPSPLNGASENDRFGGLRPWNSYSKVTDADGTVIGRTPKGLVCLISRNCFNAIGLDTKYGVKQQFNEYKKIMANKQTGHEVHKNFLASETEWINAHNEDETGIRLKNKKRLMEVHKRLEVSKERSGGFKGRKKVFIEAHAWDEKQDGKWDASRVVEEDVFGVRTKGVWKFLQQKGRHEFDEFDGTVTKDIAEEAKGSGNLAEQAVKAKSDVLLAAAATASKERELKAVEWNPMGLQELFALAGIDVPTASDQVGKAASGQEGGDDVPSLVSDVIECSDLESDDDESDDDDNDPAERLTSFFTPVGVSSKPSSAIAKAQGGNPTMPSPKLKIKVALRPVPGRGKSSARPPASSSSQSGARPEASPQRAQASPPSDAPRVMVTPTRPQATPWCAESPSTDTFRVDGRGLRLHQAITTFCADAVAALAIIQFDEEHEGGCLIGEPLIEFRRALTLKRTTLGKLRNDVKKMLVRIESSTNSSSFDDERRKVEELQSKIDALTEFLDFIKGPTHDLGTALAVTKVVLACS